MLLKKKCHVLGLDKNPPKKNILNNFLRINLNQDLRNLNKIKIDDYDHILLLDLVNHLKYPEEFMENLKNFFQTFDSPTIIVTTPNIGFIFNRIQLFFGFFNYGKRGVLHPNHTRLFTVKSFKTLLKESGYEILSTKASPAPFENAFGKNIFSSSLILLNKILILFSKNLFGYSILIKAKPTPNLNTLLNFAHKESKKNNCNLVLPEDVITSKDHNSKGVLKSLDQINDNDLILDIGKKTLQNIIKVIDESKTILWNGPAGYFEIDEFSAGSRKIAKKISENTQTKSLVSIAGGGDTVAAINKFKCSNGFTYLSTAGGAFLELLEGKILPGIKALEINE